MKILIKTLEEKNNEKIFKICGGNVLRALPDTNGGRGYDY